MKNTDFDVHVAENYLSAAPVDEAQMCTALVDFYRFPARRAAGRLFRTFLDKQGITLLELLYDKNRLAQLARQEHYLNLSIQKIADLQSEGVRAKAHERIDTLWSVFIQIRKHSEMANFNDGLAILDQQGMDAMLAATAANGLPDELDLRAGGVIAAAIGREATWMGKVGVVLDLLNLPCSDKGRELLDRVLAEILDGNLAAHELLEGQPNMGASLLNLTRLATGQWTEVHWAVPAGAQLNTTMSHLDLPQTRNILLERIARDISALQPLGREDDDADRAAFISLLDSLCSSAGLWGGGPMTKAIVRRARMTFCRNHEDLPFDQALKLLLDRLPSGLVRLGFLLDISTTSLWERYQSVVLNQLLTHIDGIHALSDLLPPGGTTEFLEHAARDLTRRFKESALPDEAGALFAAKMAQFLVSADTVAESLPEAPLNASIFKRKGLPRHAFAAGTYLFREGDTGSEAYIVISGQVEVIRHDGETEKIVAILERGAILGEMALIDDKPRMATARTCKETVLAVVPRARFKAKLERAIEADHVIGLLINTFVERLRRLPPSFPLKPSD